MLNSQIKILLSSKNESKLFLVISTYEQDIIEKNVQTTFYLHFKINTYSIVFS